jgi:hypothetical protein
MAPETTGAATGRHFPLGGGLAQNGHFRDFGRGAPPLREYAGYAKTKPAGTWRIIRRLGPATSNFRTSEFRLPDLSQTRPKSGSPFNAPFFLS